MVDKTKFKDSRGKYITQGLFLEDRYNTDLAVFTLDGEDKKYKGKTYPSLKKLYLKHADPVEYDFANTNLFDWDHWQRMCNNSFLRTHDKWRRELELSLMSEGVQVMIQISSEGKSYQAAKYLADHGWVTGKKGRPSKDDVDAKIKEMADEELGYSEGVTLLEKHRGK